VLVRVEAHRVSYSLTLGPFHPAWRGPVRFIMDLEGETITNIDQHTGMNDRGCAERITRIPLSQSMALVPRVCGTCGHAHMLAFCQAIEMLIQQLVWSTIVVHSLHSKASW